MTKYYDSTGIYKAYTNDDKNLFDEKGEHIGYFQNKFLYDTKGNAIGHVKGKQIIARNGQVIFEHREGS